jgi:putative ABC transport system ATP-binding protein
LFRRHHIGIVFQFFNLIDTLTVAENVALPLELVGTKGAAAVAAVREIVGRVGLADRLESFPDQLSGGEQQRVALARALVHQPALVLADEPTGNLDEHTGDSVLDLLDQLTRQRGAGLVLVTHSTKAASIADRVVVMRDGRVSDPTAST